MEDYHRKNKTGLIATLVIWLIRGGKQSENAKDQNYCNLLLDMPMLVCKPELMKSKSGAITRLTAIGTDLNQNQLLHILQNTPEEQIYTRTAKGGGT